MFLAFILQLLFKFPDPLDENLRISGDAVKL
jgi:hypothetical protein